MSLDTAALVTDEEQVGVITPEHVCPARPLMKGALMAFTLCLSLALALFGLRASVRGPTIASTASSVLLIEKPWPPTCADVSTDESFATCFQHLNWARTIGIKNRPDWYTDSGGLTEHSSNGDWQNYFFNKKSTKNSYMNNQWYCPPYCNKSMPACMATIDVYSSAHGNWAIGPILDTYTIGCGVCTRTKNGLYRAEGCHEYGLECYSTLLNIVPCDQLDVVHHEFPVYADGAVSSGCCNAKTGGCGFACMGRVSRSSVVQPTPTPFPPTSKKWPPPCADATVDPRFATCLQELRWAKQHGIKGNPQWYWSNLSASSSDAAFQRFFFAKKTTRRSYENNQWYCPPPCKEDIPPCIAKVDLLTGGQNYGWERVVDSFSLKCNECTQTRNGRYKVTGCHQYGLTCSTTLIEVVPCDDHMVVHHHGFHVYADGDTSYNCCNVKTGGCGYKCRALVS